MREIYSVVKLNLNTCFILRRVGPLSTLNNYKTNVTETLIFKTTPSRKPWSWRCEEMERKLRYIETEIVREGIGTPDVQVRHTLAQCSTCRNFRSKLKHHFCFLQSLISSFLAQCSTCRNFRSKLKHLIFLTFIDFIIFGHTGTVLNLQKFPIKIEAFKKNWFHHFWAHWHSAQFAEISDLNWSIIFVFYIHWFHHFWHSAQFAESSDWNSSITFFFFPYWLKWSISY